ncbi:LmbE family protein [Beutenbergia cavernae DSM 12333]|uniref:LmbE family protein n=1 Tax=Beutenbergia cavernae (strain ATCC BAA-8 / DSM 12333 / CCUG 43141 / JCM 11478 / NBRC 16432 / NCIMB 13614 / HKI 0122) TaxID=471853 RepID=C5C0Y0_BEUC1|nr:PIG-L family deacetylase [Beutenbergia cavernae]ACQ79384.1 LmbE family protein [Beutenbergia cavernae DSM 12333]
MIAPDGPLLAVFAHPDDETLTGGGVLALAVARGRRTVVVTANRGERGEIIPLELAHLEGRPDDVAALRTQELRGALAELGVAEHRFLDELAVGPRPVRYTDSGMAWLAPGRAGPAPDAAGDALTSADIGPAAAALAELVRQLRPSLVVTDEPGGGYGHPDHVRTHAIVVRALEVAALRPGSDGAPPWDVPVLAWVVRDAERLRAARAAVTEATEPLALRGADGAPLVAPGAAEELPSIARAPEQVDVELDLVPVLPRLVAAMRAYRSQAQAVTVPVLDAAAPDPGALSPDQAAVGWFALSNGVLAPILPVVSLQLAKGDVDDVGLGRPLSRNGEPSAPARSGGVYAAAAVAVCVVLGVLVGAGGTAVHRWVVTPWQLPLGAVLALGAVAAGAFLARGLGHGAALFGYAVGLVATVQAMAFLQPGGDVLIASDGRSLVWLYGSVLVCGLAAFAPRRWFADAPRT